MNLMPIVNTTNTTTLRVILQILQILQNPNETQNSNFKKGSEMWDWGFGQIPLIRSHPNP
jgi:hypothetical protein